MFNPAELRDADGKWTVSGLLKHGVSVETHHGGVKTVQFKGRPVGQVVGRYGNNYEAQNRQRKRISGHQSISEAAAHVVATHLNKDEPPPTKTWTAPPAPTGVTGRKAGGFTAVGITNTKLGDTVEAALIKKMGFEDAHPGRRQGPLDLIYDGHGYEVKAVSQSAMEYKAKPKKAEVESKINYADEHHLQPHVMIVVYHPKEQKLYVYSKPGIGAYRLTGPDQGWKYHGTLPISLGKSWDPVDAHA